MGPVDIYEYEQQQLWGPHGWFTNMPRLPPFIDPPPPPPGLVLRPPLPPPLPPATTPAPVPRRFARAHRMYFLP